MTLSQIVSSSALFFLSSKPSITPIGVHVYSWYYMWICFRPITLLRLTDHKILQVGLSKGDTNFLYFSAMVVPLLYMINFESFKINSEFATNLELIWNTFIIHLNQTKIYNQYYTLIKYKTHVKKYKYTVVTSKHIKIRGKFSYDLNDLNNYYMVLSTYSTVVIIVL